MGRFSSFHQETSDSIVILRWNPDFQSASAAHQFWTLDCPSKSATTSSLPVPEAVPLRFNGSKSKDALSDGKQSGSTVNLPPHLMFDSDTKSILVHKLQATEKGVDVELSRLAPGLHFALTQDKGDLFAQELAGLPDAKFFSQPAIIRPGRRHGWTEDDNSSGPSMLLKAMALKNNDGTVQLKYRGRKIIKKSLYMNSLPGNHYRYKEQTLRISPLPDGHGPVSWARPQCDVPVYLHSIGRNMKYLLLAAVGENFDRSQTIISLNTMEQSTIIQEADSIRKPDEDLGVRWQTQSFQLPSLASGITFTVINVDRKEYLVVFYLLKGVLYHSCYEYVGSGSFQVFVEGEPCRTDSTSLGRDPTPTRYVTQTSRLSLSSYFPKRPIELAQDSKTEHQPAPSPQGNLPLGSEGCQPYAVQVNGSIWLFYEGADLRGTFARHKLPQQDFQGFKDGWESTSWMSELSPNETAGQKTRGSATHFIPVVVPEDYMNMF